MLMKPHYITTFLTCLVFSLASFSQPRVHPAGDGWHLQVDSALSLIKKYDKEKYDLVDSVCSEIEFWVSDFSSNEISKGEGKIYIASADVRIGSINNLACVIVHESLHLFFLKSGIRTDKKTEERLCYQYELELLNKIPGVEPWLLKHTKIKITQNK